MIELSSLFRETLKNRMQYFKFDNDDSEKISLSSERRFLETVYRKTYAIAEKNIVFNELRAAQGQ